MQVINVVHTSLSEYQGPLRNIIATFHTILGSISWTAQHVKRGTNCVVHTLAREALLNQVEILNVDYVAPCIRPLVLADSLST